MANVMIVSAPYGWKNPGIRFSRNTPAIARIRGKDGQLRPMVKAADRFTSSDLPPGNYEIDVNPEPEDFELEGEGNKPDDPREPSPGTAGNSRRVPELSG